MIENRHWSGKCLELQPAVLSNESTSTSADSAVTMGITAVGVFEIESIVAKAIAAATEVIRKEFDKALLYFHNHLSVVDEKLDNFEGALTNSAEMTHDTAQIEAFSREARQFTVAANDNEQYSRRNNLRFKGLNIPKADGVDYCKIAADFVWEKFNLPIGDNDIELAHPLPAKTNSSMIKCTLGRRRITNELYG